MLAAGEVLAEENRYELIHGHDWLVAHASSALAERARVPYVTTIHATEHGRHQGWVQDAPQSHIHAVERWMAARANGVIVCSHYMRGHVADVFDIDERRITVIPNGIDPSELQPAGDLQTLRSRFAEPHEKLVLLVGRLVYEKGFQLALDALPGVVRQVENVRYLVAGSGTHEEELKAQAERLGLSDHGHFLVGERVGLRFNGGDAEHLGVMIERLLVDEALRERLVTEASEHVLSFDWDEIAQRTQGVYSQLRELRPREEGVQGG
jgi:glycogen(starch) synthase